jgi:hypothetical protein
MSNEPTMPAQAPTTHIGTINNDKGFVVTGGNNTFNVDQTETRANLAEVAAEIQNLLNQLSQSYPTETVTQQAIVTEKAIAEIEKDPSLKERVRSVLAASGTEAFKQAVDHPAIHIMIAAIDGWRKP